MGEGWVCGMNSVVCSDERGWAERLLVNGFVLVFALSRLDSRPVAGT